MIGVVVQPDEREIVAEFFELYKTAWEFYRRGRDYDVLLCTLAPPERNGARLVILFSSARTLWDAEHKVAVKLSSERMITAENGQRLPLYGTVAAFPGQPNRLLASGASGEPIAWAHRSDRGMTVRAGYHLFAEVRRLMTTGQPAENAAFPTLELHIALLRTWIVQAGLPSVEIPPVPEGCRFIACLTHDIDHASLQSHGLDHTTLGFLYRATIGTLGHVLRGRRPLSHLWRNGAAGIKLPLVHLGLARDPWGDFDRYLELEAGRPSTFYAIPARDDPGRTGHGPGPAMRVCRYDLNRLRPQLGRIASAGCEIGVHGLDAWIDPEAARREREKVAQVTGADSPGVRMHWLYFDERSPAILENAGFSYDSTFGYNETVGYRAGTAQVFKPVGAAALLELPLQVMDTALFSPGMMNLDSTSAAKVVRNIVDEAARFGGALTINWHDRSIAPERLWTAFYADLMNQLTQRGAWFATANQAVLWFTKRRNALLESMRLDSRRLTVHCKAGEPCGLPGLRLRVYQPCPDQESPEAAPVDYPLNPTTELTVAI